MAGRGPAPKPADQRRRYNQPARGEWVDLSPLEAPVLPVAGEWSARVVKLWDAWRADPVSGQYTESDIAAAWELAENFERLAAGEQRLRMDGLGLTPKGKRDLRWRTPAEAAPVSRQGSKVRRLRVVDSEVA